MLCRFHPRAALAALLCAASGCAFAAPAAPSPEQQLFEGIDQMRSGDADGAYMTLSTLTREQPNFRLANLFYGELLAALSGAPGDTLIENSADPQLRDLAEEARLRLAAEKATPAPGMLPSDILQLSPRDPYVIVVDLPKARLYLLKNDADGQMQLVRQQYAGMGRKGYGKQASGDLRTPLGVYHITRWISKEKLPEIYGAGAFPLNYPNLWDQFKKRDGAGIWLHGVPPDTYVRAPRSSEGCVTMANDDLLALKPYITLGQTPVILSDDLKWEPEADLREQRDAFLARIEDWRRKWSAKDTAGYLAYYGKDFTADGMNYAAFVAHKKRVNAAKKSITVKLRDINLFRYPGTNGDLMLAEFTLEYRSDNYSTTSQKQQFWKRDEKGQWKIFREENL
ncbi:MAG: L,D-transpeptidase Cds6 family protein [Stenotrophobium sp.]